MLYVLFPTDYSKEEAAALLGKELVTNTNVFFRM